MLGQSRVEDLNVLREPGQHSARRSLVKELERCAENAEQHGQVEDNGGPQTADLREKVAEKRGNA